MYTWTTDSLGNRLDTEEEGKRREGKREREREGDKERDIRKAYQTYMYTWTTDSVGNKPDTKVEGYNDS